jgi:hypothetical protein
MITTRSFVHPYQSVLQPLWHRFNTLVDEVLTDLVPSFKSYFSGVVLIPVRKLLDVLLWWLPAVLNRGNIWARMTVEVVIQLVVLLPLAYDVVFA